MNDFFGTSTNDWGTGAMVSTGLGNKVIVHTLPLSKQQTAENTKDNMSTHIVDKLTVSGKETFKMISPLDRFTQSHYFRILATSKATTLLSLVSVCFLDCQIFQPASCLLSNLSNKLTSNRQSIKSDHHREPPSLWWDGFPDNKNRDYDHNIHPSRTFYSLYVRFCMEEISSIKNFTGQ